MLDPIWPDTLFRVMCRCTKVGGTLVPRTCARAVVAPCGKACWGNAKNLHGPFLGRMKTKYLSQEDEAPARGACRAEKTGPRQEELAGPRRQDPGKRSLPGRPSRSTKAPARGARREGQNKAPQEKLATAHHAPRQGLTSGKLSGTARQPPRQATCRGKSPSQACAPAHLPTRHSGALPEARGIALRGLRRAVACTADRITVVASGGAPNGPPRR